jgi:hypothetical protein
VTLPSSAMGASVVHSALLPTASATFVIGRQPVGYSYGKVGPHAGWLESVFLRLPLLVIRPESWAILSRQAGVNRWLATAIALSFPAIFALIVASPNQGSHHERRHWLRPGFK